VNHMASLYRKNLRGSITTHIDNAKTCKGSGCSSNRHEQAVSLFDHAIRWTDIDSDVTQAKDSRSIVCELSKNTAVGLARKQPYKKSRLQPYS
jgi:hypothetical protein